MCEFLDIEQHALKLWYLNFRDLTLLYLIDYW